MTREDYLKKLKVVRSNFEGVTLTRISIKNAGKAHTNSIRAAYNWALKMYKSKEYIDHIGNWSQSSDWDYYIRNQMTTLREYRLMKATQRIFQDMWRTTMPSCLRFGK